MGMQDMFRSLMGLMLPGPAFAFLREAGEKAAARNEHLYMVGGIVRDLLLKRPTMDIDLAVEGNGPGLAYELASISGAGVTVHRRFGTATLRLGDFSVDIATTRSETYDTPGALPKVQPGRMKEDLSRRDFSVNAMAVSLAPDDFGALLDPLGGMEDLQRQSIRILHEKSFTDDPTRAWRAVRYEQRLGFHIEPGTLLLLQRDLPLMDNVSGDRIRHELELVLKEPFPEKALLRADELGLLKQAGITPLDRGSLPGRFALARELYAGRTDLQAVYLALLCFRMLPQDIGRLIQELHFPVRTAVILREISGLASLADELSVPGLQPSRIYTLLQGKNSAALQAAALYMGPVVSEHIDVYLNVLRYIKPSLKGTDLARLGVPENNRRAEMLETLKYARLDGKVTSKADEEAMVKALLE